ncbi:hypothetical protein JCM19275_1592 [Nonlabens ulvanivorans]|uniref:HD-CE domain-containing protein n=1 Tax=Nonlabens ulvanivorans TaxID=906888 RepID=A0A090WJX7_NONUL|nr:hypothetical protein [Nonlabens ulvanivorans]GAL75709.1 hypothetical protein JCM19275_1592 [Nonlabens ulvanivorans]
MANIIIPESLNSLLQKDQRLDGIVKKTLSDFGEILKENNLFFFEEYTDHGLEHIQNVLHGSSKLVSDDTLENILTSDDIAFYILSVILHDIGMHLTLDGFKILLSGGEYDNLTPELSELSWENLWQNYLSEAKRFSGKQLISIFGNEDIEIRNPLILKAGELNGNDRKLIGGEFIRRHHPRIAHEIAINGFPSLEKNKIPFASELNIKQLDLIGLIARSHGMNLRKCVEFLENKHGNSRRIPLGIHASYLMILLRISDYLQIDSSRVSKIVMKTKTFESPISELEHNSHLAIDFIDDKYQDDPERIHVSAAPKDSFMYLKLKKLFKSIQTEFDISWAVLGELYGNLENKPLIKFRRISSNLDDLNYIKEQTYIGDYISFKANDDITKLLIGPLYGNHPKYGIRELIQNSVDACNERSEIENFNLDYSAEVNIEIIENANGKFLL